RTLVLSQGSNTGLRPEMAVISTDGVVGKLITVSPNASRVLLVNDHNAGMDGIFPGGLLVGEVKQVSQEGPGLFLNIAIAPAVDFSRIEQVLVLTERPPQVAANPVS